MDYRRVDLFHPIDISEYYQECLDKWGIDSMPALSMIHAYRFEGVSYRTMATASYPGISQDNHLRQGVMGDEYAVCIHMPIFRAIKVAYGKDAAMKELRDVIIHELAHIAAYYTTRNPRVQAHGEVWGSLMMKAGLPWLATCVGRQSAFDLYRKSPDKYTK
jgi:hypothetical protein